MPRRPTIRESQAAGGPRGRSLLPGASSTRLLVGFVRAASLATCLLATALTPVRAAEPVAPTGTPGPDGQGLARRLASLCEERIARPAAPNLERTWANFRTAIRRAQFLLRYYDPSEAVLTRADAELRSAETSLRALRAGNAPPAAGGEQCEGYFSEIDGSFQPFLRYLPSGTNAAPATAGRPLIVFLHGYSPYLNIVNWDAFPVSLLSFAEREGFCLVAPFGRGNTDYQGIGEQDVLCVIAEMEKRYGTDPERVLLTGASMGGMGVWSIGAHYPDRFAGLLVVSGRGDYYTWQKLNRAEVPSYKRTLIDAEFAGSLSGNLRTVPVLSVHGAADTVILPDEARYMARLMTEEGGPFRHIEIPDGDHYVYDAIFEQEDVRTWIKACRRSTPRSFTYTTWLPRYRGAWWVRAEGWVRREGPVKIAAHTDADAVVVTAEGARQVRVDRSRMPVALRTAHLMVKDSPGVALTEDKASPGEKSAIQAAGHGPIKDALLAPFLMVQAAPASSTNVAARFAAALDDWRHYAHAEPRAAAEGELTPQRLAAFNVILIGEPEDSPLIREVLATSPVTIEDGRYRVGSVTYPRSGYGLYLVRPSPWAPDRVAVIQCGIGWGRFLPPNHKYDWLPDYIVYGQEPDADGSNQALCAGFFDEDWGLCDSLQYVRPGTR